uniref:TLDc domain-containing protein n=1 Tax=Salarias fasciatus TaxID=181472 RepID=A0A672FUA6_SALFA
MQTSDTHTHTHTHSLVFLSLTDSVCGAAVCPTVCPTVCPGVCPTVCPGVCPTVCPGSRPSRPVGLRPQLSRELPAWTEGRAWTLSYSTSRHGASLQSLYRRLRAADSPVLLVIRDALDEVFGAFLSHPLRPSEEFYGTGETFLFMLHPRFKCFRWTGDNCFFIKGYRDAFAIGGGSGHFGLWLDEDLYLGHSSPCYTFNNCCLSETSDFRVTELEVWTFS